VRSWNDFFIMIRGAFRGIYGFLLPELTVLDSASAVLTTEAEEEEDSVLAWVVSSTVTRDVSTTVGVKRRALMGAEMLGLRVQTIPPASLLLLPSTDWTPSPPPSELGGRPVRSR